MSTSNVIDVVFFLRGNYRPMQIWNNEFVNFPPTLETFRAERIILHADFSYFKKLHKIRLIDVVPKISFFFFLFR